MENLKYKVGFRFILKEDCIHQDGFSPKGTKCEILEVDTNRYDTDDELEPYQVYFQKTDGINCFDENDKCLGGNDWFNEREIEDIIDWDRTKDKC